MLSPQFPSISSTSSTERTYSEPHSPVTSPSQAQTYPQTANPRTFSAQDYLKLPRGAATWLIEPLLPTGGSVLLYGDPKVGKSFAALQMASCLGSGIDFLGFHIPRPVKTLYIQLDTPRSLWADRIEKLLSQGLPLESILMADRETLDTWPFDILNPDHANLLSDVLVGTDAELFILDTLREAHTGDENDSTAMQAVIAQLTAAVKPAALVVVSHSRKSNPEYGYDLMNDNRGSNYLVGKMDAICRMSHTTIRVSGRAIDEQSIQLARLDNGLWGLGDDPLRQKADLIMAMEDLSMWEMAKLLNEAFPAKSVSACRAYLRRRAAAK